MSVFRWPRWEVVAFSSVVAALLLATLMVDRKSLPDASAHAPHPGDRLTRGGCIVEMKQPVLTFKRNRRVVVAQGRGRVVRGCSNRRVSVYICPQTSAGILCYRRTGYVGGGYGRNGTISSSGLWYDCRKTPKRFYTAIAIGPNETKVGRLHRDDGSKWVVC